MIRVLFVDDEACILRGLRRMFFQLGDDWQVNIAMGGPAALALLEKQAVDVVVSDMRMPGMNGNELLHQVHALYPEVARIILSGHSDNDMILESTAVAHRYLSKPCNADELIENIRECCEASDRSESPQLVKLVSQLKTIPSVPALYSEVVEACEHDADLSDIGRIVMRDVGMTSKVMHLVNSAFFGLQRRVVDIEGAVSFIGIEPLKSLILNVELFSSFTDLENVGISPELISMHCLRVGRLAQSVARLEGAPKAVLDASFLAGGLHDVGRAVLLMNDAESCQRHAELMREEGCALPKIEREQLGTTHAELGAHLLKLWGLPHDVVNAVDFHHEPCRHASSEFDAVCAVHVAECFVARLEGEHESSEGPLELDLDYIESLSLMHRLPEWEETLAQMKEEAA